MERGKRKNAKGNGKSTKKDWRLFFHFSFLRKQLKVFLGLPMGKFYWGKNKTTNLQPLTPYFFCIYNQNFPTKSSNFWQIAEKISNEPLEHCAFWNMLLGLKIVSWILYNFTPNDPFFARNCHWCPLNLMHPCHFCIQVPHPWSVDVYLRWFKLTSLESWVQSTTTKLCVPLQMTK